MDSSISSPGTKRKSKAEILREYRSKNGKLFRTHRQYRLLTTSEKSHIPELYLMRDMLYLLQGISGKYVQFASVRNFDPSQLVFRDDAVSFPCQSLWITA
jgi:gamma-tubulin complex component 3